MAKKTNSLNQDSGISKFSESFSMKDILGEVQSGKTEENIIVEDASETEEEIVSEKAKKSNETIKGNPSFEGVGSLRDYLNRYADEKTFNNVVYIHDEIKELLVGMKENLDSNDKTYVQNLASAMIYGFFQEHKEEIKSMIVKKKKKKSLLD